MYGYGYSYPNNTQGSGLMGNYEAGVRTDGGFFAFPIDTGLASRLEALGLLNASSLVNSCNAGKADVLYNLIPTPVQALDRFTVVRSTVKRVLNSSGVLAEVAINTPAFEFNTDGTYRGLLVEPAGTNLLTYSQGFDDASWSKTNIIVTANSIASPDGTTTADTLTEGTLGTALLQKTASGTVTAGATVTGSIFVKVGSENDFIRFVVYDNAASTNRVTTWFRFSTGVVSGTANQGTATGASASVQALPNGWYRISLSGAIPTATTYGVFASSADASGSATRVNNSVYYAWGAQLETGSVATSYIPTVASTQTRTADSVTLTGASSLIGQPEGSMFMEFEFRNSGVATRVFGLSTGTPDTNNSFRLNKGATGTLSYTGTTASASQFTITSGGTYVGQIVRAGVAYNTDDVVFYAQGVQIGTDATSTTPAFTTITLGVTEDGLVHLNGWIRSVALFPTRLSNATLASLTA